MEPQYMVMGQSAGVAASMAIKSDRAAQLIDVYELRRKLLEQKQVLSLKDNPYGLWNSQDVIIIDNNMKGFVSFTGDWFEEEKVNAERYEMNFRYCPEGRKGVFEYRPYLFKDGTYDVFIWYPSSKTYNNNVPLFIKHSDGLDKTFINQQEDGGNWQKVGQYKFSKGRGSSVSIVSDLSSGIVVADAIKFELVR
jgi:hypothetical protein